MTKPELTEFLREMLYGGECDPIAVGDLTDVMNGRDDGLSYHVTQDDITEALDELVMDGMLEQIPEGYRCTAAYLTECAGQV